MKKAQLILIMFGLLSMVVCLEGCSSTDTKPVKAAAVEASESKSPIRESKGIITGRAFIKTRGGDIKMAAGQTIRLRRKGIYSDQWFELASNRKVHTAAYDYRLEDYVFMTRADDDGRFTFKDVPAGEYILSTKIPWFDPGDVYFGSLSKQITVENDKTLYVILTR